MQNYNNLAGHTLVLLRLSPTHSALLNKGDSSRRTNTEVCVN